MNDELPDDINDEEKYVALPDKRKLGLGKPLVLDFARQFLPADFDDVRYFFGRRGTYPKFRALLADEARSIAGTPSKRKPRSMHCATGARCIRSKWSADLGAPFRIKLRTRLSFEISL
ncbi:hypothetical protein QA640_05945 [Bradyrhizobium sp. CB82]|uniref:hypothetical protein n=1 Tax=Bradyrhizobium sp. CB82 TaxID=3039159 RepID=UPI0024B24711|nr:hypothetical protein [Bradyrhizobium sp. CB82]WFU42035.1 hypothetical protein QA640_05945 [Bradyrhizobium sp. CB82]